MPCAVFDARYNKQGVFFFAGTPKILAAEAGIELSKQERVSGELSERANGCSHPRTEQHDSQSTAVAQRAAPL